MLEAVDLPGTHAALAIMSRAAQKAGASSKADTQAKARGPLTQLAEWVLALHGLAGKADRKFLKGHYQWAAAYAEDPAKVTIVPAPVRGARIGLNVRIGEVDDIPLSIRLEGPSSDDAKRIEALAWRNHNGLPEHLRPERPPTAEG